MRTEEQPNRIAVMSLSGGMDSTGVLTHLLARGYTVYALSYYYGQKHSVELERAKTNVAYMREMGLDIAEHKVVDLSSAMGIFHSALTSDDIDVPEGHYEQENMVATVVPNRNSIFSSIVYGYALSIATENDCDVKICLGVHSGDHAIYPDCRPEFYEELEKVFALGNWGSEKVSFYLPYIEGDKTTILQDSLTNCKILGLDFDEVFANTNTSYNPDAEGRSSGKSGADVERILAFIDIDRKDPVEYVGGWDAARSNALKVRDEWDAEREEFYANPHS